MSDAGSSSELSASTHDSDVITDGLKHRSNTQHRAIAFKVSYTLVTLFFIWLFFIHAIGLFFFTKGFLLTRLVLEDQSSCDVLPNGSLSQVHNGCWHPKTFNKAVILVIDALRYDFTVPDPTIAPPSPASHYRNQLPFLWDTAVHHPDKAFLRPFIADPPTSTLQRLKGLTAGNLPVFIDIGSNFAGQATEEDNLLVQLKSQGKSVAHLGDDTWHSLFPGYFNENLTHAYDSFNVWDLHSVDNGVIEHIFPLLHDQNSSQWDIIIGHCLGVDHAGHQYGPEHPAMADKLRQMNDVVSRLAHNIDDDTLLVVMGDHGMDSSGNHGGESDDEVEAALWMYSNGPRFGRSKEQSIQPPRTAKQHPVQQIDLVSTLSLLLGLPVPFNNLGSPIPEAFMRHIPATLSDEQNLATANLLVFDQMQQFQSRYTQLRNFTEKSDIAALRQQLQGVSSDHPQANILFTAWHQATVSMYRELWANFTLYDMAIGVALLCFGVFMLCVISFTSSPDCENDLPLTLRNAAVGAILAFGISVPSLTLNPTLGQVLSSTGPISTITFGSLFGGIAARIPAMRFASRPSMWTWLATFFTISQAAGFASNSYTIHEDTILTFLLTTFAIVALLSSLRQSSGPDRVLGTYHSLLFATLTRAASFSRLCREEQMPGCRSTFYPSQLGSSSASWQLLIPSIISFFLPEVIKSFYKGTASYVGSAPFWIGLCFRGGLMLTTLYWVLDAAETGDWLVETLSASSLKTCMIIIARCVLAIAVPVGMSTLVWAKPCVDISIFRPAAERKNTDAKPQVTILGYANVFGTRYLLLLPVFVLSILLLLPPMGQFSIAICAWQILSLLEILDTNNLIILNVNQSIIGPVVLAMLGSYHFFKTGHQAVLSSIQWKAAFVPLRTIRYPWSPILIVLNNFGPQLLCAAAVPLTVLWKRPISKQGLRGFWSDVMQACMSHVLYYAIIQAATTMWAGHLRRHLMLYRVFMPRFLVASGVLLTIDVLLIVVALGAATATGASVAEIFGY